ncbi:MAG: HAMP domain-containing sensor histidine kinase [Paracoccaceae bacterium]|nr:HAMP domain-containing sensor histidine kinase [Paracoccaceae bacterium]
MTALKTLRSKGVMLVLVAALIGSGAVWIWMHSHAAWQNHLQTAFNTGLVLSDTLRQQEENAPDVFVFRLNEKDQALADIGKFSSLGGSYSTQYTTILSLQAGSLGAQSRETLSLAIVSPDLRYPLGDITQKEGMPLSVAFAHVTRLLASYCSDPLLFVRHEDKPWHRVDGSKIWGCQAAPPDQRPYAFLLAVLGLGFLIFRVQDIALSFSNYAMLLRAQRRKGGHEASQVEGPQELRDIVKEVNAYLEREHAALSKRTMVLSGVSHDLGAPATRLRLRAALINDQELREKLERDIDQMTSMIDSVLSYTRSELNAENPRKLSLRSLVSAIVDDYQDLGKPVTMADGGSIRVPMQHSVFDQKLRTRAIKMQGLHQVVVTARPIALRRAVSNLIENALKYGRRADVRLEANSGQATIIVSDQGGIIDSDIIERLTAPFWRGENSEYSPGFGLGLTIVDTIATQHDGSITFYQGAQGLEVKFTIQR